ncbi:helix-turn-helix domain-containing protein [Galactobacillus timonensis]|uniref:helix-turn-helix domain-containing protein n=1 Tax=Galactobacillus timonensis TaxID=2041840 RepID=UPI000C81AABD|nr:helix-turn-helix domain-containing protein [Galactobacillus timonensis]
MKKGYMVQVISDDIVGCQYLEQDQKTISEKGYVWRSKQAAENSMRSASNRLSGQHPGSSLRIVEVDGDNGQSVADADTDGAMEAKESEAPILSLDEIERIAGNWAELMAHFNEYKKTYTARLREEDLRTQDLLHYLELNDLADAEAVDVAHRLSESRRKRREAKDALHLLDLMAGARYEAQAVERGLDKLEHRSYNVRFDDSLPVVEEDGSLDETVSDPEVDMNPADPQEEGTESDEYAQNEGLSELDVLSLRVYQDAQDGMTRAALAVAYGVSKSTISRYLKRAEALSAAESIDADDLPF